MKTGAKSIELDPDTYAVAKRIAEKDHVSVDVLLGSLIQRHAEYIERFDSTAEPTGFSLDHYVMDRAPEESEEDYEARLALFR